jgi:hypothetical protein
MCLMRLLRRNVYKFIINEDYYKCLKIRTKNIIHGGLKCWRFIRKSKWHQQEFKISLNCIKICFECIFRSYQNMVVDRKSSLEKIVIMWSSSIVDMGNRSLMLTVWKLLFFLTFLPISIKNFPKRELIAAGYQWKLTAADFQRQLTCSGFRYANGTAIHDRIVFFF